MVVQLAVEFPSVAYVMGSTASSSTGQMISGQAISGHGWKKKSVVTAEVVQVFVGLGVRMGSVMGPVALTVLK